MNKRRIGKFYVNMDMLEGDLDTIRRILLGVIVIKAKLVYETDCIEYLGICDHFDVVPPGDMAPDYRCAMPGFNWMKI
jgi:hypothetical protein